MAFKHPRIFIPELPSDGGIIITGDKYYHLGRSVRARVGDTFQLFNGKGLFADAEIESIDSESIKARIIESRVVDNTPKVKLTLAFGLLPPDPLKQLLAGATQLGVVSFIPFFSEFNDLKFNSEKTEKTLERWHRIIIENSAVASRSHLPEISQPVDFEKLISISESSEMKLVFWEEGGRPWREILPLDSGNVIAVIGPKGGLSESEIGRFRSSGFQILSFGDLILKAEFAALTACARIIGK
jgi:16S rRNA (uracil1498-N3)-methyltransferase